LAQLYQNNKPNKESLIVNPKYMNMTLYKSFQLDCIYHGANYLNVKLIWLKNDNILEVENEKRMFTLDYKQNNTSICILKFRFPLLVDAGIYKCVAIDKTKKNSAYLNDTAYLVMHQSK
jgi:hypothetical protein